MLDLGGRWLFRQGGNVQVLEEGQTVRHEQYGVGTVTESNVERTTIDFDDYGVKKFVTSIWSAEIIGDVPAERPARRRSRRTTRKK
jgi:hypothetical protein